MSVLTLKQLETRLENWKKKCEIQFANLDNPDYMDACNDYSEEVDWGGYCKGCVDILESLIKEMKS